MLLPLTCTALLTSLTPAMQHVRYSMCLLRRWSRVTTSLLLDHAWVAVRTGRHTLACVALRSRDVIHWLRPLRCLSPLWILPYNKWLASK